METIKVYKKEPGKKAVLVDIPNTLEALQQAVDGYIENYPFDYKCGALCNEEGILRRLPYNCFLEGMGFYGTILLIGYKGEDFADWPLDRESTELFWSELFEGED